MAFAETRPARVGLNRSRELGAQIEVGIGIAMEMKIGIGIAIEIGVRAVGLGS